jgi:hypothetical protein
MPELKLFSKQRNAPPPCGRVSPLDRYLTYYHQSRTHLSLDKDSPEPRPIAPPTCGAVVASPQVGGLLHHRYDRRAA